MMQAKTVDNETGEVLVLNADDLPRIRRKLGLDTSMDVGVIDANLSNLLALYHGAKLASEDLGEAIKGTAEKAGVSPGALRRFVAARASDKYDDKRAESAQLELLFEEVA